jgi:hypothetical protein
MESCRRAGVVCPLILLVAAGLAARAQGVGIETIYTKIAGHPTAQIAGTVDLNGNAAASEWKGLESLVIKPGGHDWLVKGRTTLGADLENVAVLGSGRTGTMFIQEGQHAPGGLADERYEFFGTSSSITQPFGRFDENGRFGFAALIRNAATGTTPAANGRRVFKLDGSGVSVLFKQGDSYTGCFDDPGLPGGSAPGNETMSNTVGTVHLLNNGTVGYIDTQIANESFLLRPASFYNLAMFHQSGGTDTVTALGGSGTAGFAQSTGVAAEKFVTTPDGSHWMMAGTLAGSPSRSALVHDGVVLFQNGSSPGGGAPNVGTVSNFELLPNGHWFAWGTYAAQAGFWAVKDGAVVAKTGDPITTGSGETWGNTVYMLTGNRRGDWCIAASTSGAAAANEVIVVNTATSSSVKVREGDMADLNNDGIDNDDAFIGRGSNTLNAFAGSTSSTIMAMSDDGYVYFFSCIHNGAGADLQTPSFFGDPNGFFRVHFQPSCSTADFNGDGDVGTDADIEAFFSCLSGNCCSTCGSADFNADGDIGTDADIEAFFRVLGGGAC